jgi:hypothetical protein
MLYDTYSTSSISLNTTHIDETHILKTNVAHYFSTNGISKKLNHLANLLKQTDQDLYEHFEKNDLNNLFFCHEWLILMFKRSFPTTLEYLKCFEMLSSHFMELHTSALKNISVKNLYSFDLFICLSLLKQIREKLLKNSDMELLEILQDNKNLFAQNYLFILENAQIIFEKYCIKITNN